MNYRSLSTANFGMSNTNDLQLGVAMEKRKDAEGTADSDIQVGRTGRIPPKANQF